MQVTSLLSQHEHEAGCIGHDHEHSVVHLWQAVAGGRPRPQRLRGGLAVRLRAAAWPAPAPASARSFWVYPIVVTAIKDLRVGRLSINELVAIAVLAAFASGNYKIAGVVAFFMLTGEIIESRTAEGARAVH